MSDETKTSPGINAPDVDPKTLKPQCRAIRDAAQAYQIAHSIAEGNRERNTVNAVIVAKYDNEEPFPNGELDAIGEGWRNNFPTGFMSGIVDRVTPAAVALIDRVRFLSNAVLDPDKFPNDTAEKSEKFRTRFTKVMRSWRGWRPFCYSLSQEVTLIGYAIVGWTDEYDFRPKLYRSDQGFVPEGTEQFAESVQFAVYKQDFLISELLGIISNVKDETDEALSGWNRENAVKALNRAMPKKKAAVVAAEADDRDQVDAIREGNRGSDYENGAKVIEAYHVLAVEPSNEHDDDGNPVAKVTHYIVERNNDHAELFCKENRFASIADVIALFTLNPGNGKFYGSRGLGKILVNIHIAIEKARNIAFDQLYLAGLMITKVPKGTGSNVQMIVRHPFAVIEGEPTFEKEQIADNVEAYLKLDEKLTSIAEQAANAYIPNKLSDTNEGGDRTATEAQIDNARDTQAKVAYLARFWGQVCDMVLPVKRKMCDPETVDPAAKAFQKSLMESDGLTREEINYLANQSESESVQDMSLAENQQIMAIWQAFGADPMMNRLQMLKRTVAAMGNQQLADEFILPKDIDQAIEAEAIRQQLIENVAIMNGESMPVSPRDNHETHLKIGLSDLQRSAPGIAKLAPHNPEMLDHVQAAIVHFQAHADQMIQSGAKPDVTKPYTDAIATAQKMLDELGTHIKDVKAAGTLPPPPGAPAPAQPDAAVAVSIPDAVSLMGGISELMKAGAPITHEDINAVLAKGGLPPLANTPSGTMVPPTVLGPDGQPVKVPSPPVLPPPHITKSLSTINYDRAPSDVRRQMEQKAGYQPSVIGDQQEPGGNGIVVPNEVKVPARVPVPEAVPVVPAEPVAPAVTDVPVQA